MKDVVRDVVRDVVKNVSGISKQNYIRKWKI